MSVDPANDVMEKTDEAVALVLSGEINSAALVLTKKNGEKVPASIVRGFDAGLLELPYIDVSTVEADPRDTHFANFDASLVIEVRTHAEDIPRSEHKRLAGLVGAALWRTASEDDDTLIFADLLTAAVAGYTALYWTPGKTSRMIDGVERVTRFEGSIFARCA